MIVLVLAAISYLVLQNLQTSQPSDDGMGNAAGTMLAGSDMGSNGLIGGDALAPATVDGEVSYSIIYDAEYGFSPSTITAQAGDVVNINLRSASGTSNLLIDELGVVVPAMTPDSGDVTVPFTVDEPGTYRFYGVWAGELTGEGELIVE